jgi:hypothetical protein
MKIDLESGKYTLIHDDNGLRALRYGKPWQSLAGNKFVYCLGARIEELEAELAALKAAPQAIESDLIYSFNSGYQRGHNDTVEGCFTDVAYVDYRTYHADVVQDLIEDGDIAAPLPAVAQTPLTAGNFDDSSNGQLAKAVKALAFCAPFPGMEVPWTEAKQKEFAAVLDKYEVAPTPEDMLLFQDAGLAPTPGNASDAGENRLTRLMCSCGDVYIGEPGSSESCPECAEAAAPVAAQGDAGEVPEIVEYQCRMRWKTIETWGKWQRCSKGQYDGLLERPQVGNWSYETRALCVAAPVVNQSLTATPDLAGTRLTFLDEIDAARAGEDWLQNARTIEHRLEYLEDNGSGAMPKVKWAALFDSYDRLTHAYLLTRDLQNWCQITFVSANIRPQAPAQVDLAAERETVLKAAYGYAHAYADLIHMVRENSNADDGGIKLLETEASTMEKNLIAKIEAALASRPQVSAPKKVIRRQHRFQDTDDTQVSAPKEKP